MDPTVLFAHTPNDSGEWHSLIAHLTAVAAGARDRASAFGEAAASKAFLIGLYHDTGKANPAFQAYLRARHAGKPATKAPHSIWGAAFLYQAFRKLPTAEWRQFAMPIAGHHGGLDHGGQIALKLEDFVRENSSAIELVVQLRKQFPATGRLPTSKHTGTSEELFTRMMLSALVDADYSDTERHCSPSRAGARGIWPSMGVLVERFRANQAAFVARALDLAGSTEVNKVRQEVYSSCVDRAAGSPGIYRLTVPTGGGKTRSGMAFALEHATTHSLRRVVVAIPYTSIIDQNAQEYRRMLGSDAVLEHHSQVPVGDDDAQDGDALRQRLASEDWSAPIVVTTTVQLFESLFSNRPTRVRKLHNLARSVIVLDEVQTLPPELLQPTADALRLLVEEYGCTLVLSTATQPALEESAYLKAFQGIDVHEIVPNYADHFERLRRVRYDVRPDPMDWDELATEVSARRQVMVVLNSRRDAMSLLDALAAQGVGDVVHLSTLLCGEHRRAVLSRVKSRLADPTSPAIRLISTQVVEAGVDLDFPSVFRASGPLDRISQAAGRCNREGKLGREGGEVVVFRPASGRAPSGPYGVGLAVSAAMLRDLDNDRLHKPDTFRDYFARLFSTLGPDGLDSRHIQESRLAMDYPKTAKDYWLIGETTPIVVQYGDANRRLDEWERNPTREAWRRLQPFLVSVRDYDLKKLEREHLVTEVSEGLYFCDKYDDRLGIAQALFDPSDLDT